MRFSAYAFFFFASSYAADAVACGGLFCSNTSPTPVDQAAERILFEILDDDTVSATVEIKYQGDPREFSWIVPVSGTPDFVDVAASEELQLLDLATQPSFTRPSVSCVRNDEDGGEGSEGEGEEGEGEGVDVIEYPSVGPFDQIVVVEGRDPQVLMDWLNDHGYRVTEGMLPFIEEYIFEGYKFLATQLRDDADVTDMVPIRFHCPNPSPEIPLRLTAISAEPEMGFLVFIAGPQRFTPTNYQELRLTGDELRMGIDTRRNALVFNYFPTVSKRIDEAGGRAFVVERAQDAATIRGRLDNVFLGTETEAVARANLERVLDNRAFVTRLYGRMNAEEMIADPIFRPAVDTSVVDGTYDLSGQESPENCSLPIMPACGDTYCGEGDACAETALGDGCVCRGSHVARAVTSPTGGTAVACMPPDIDLHAGGDPCSGNPCGNGTCLPVNDRPTCACDAGSAAVIDRGRVTCVATTGDVKEADALLWDLSVRVGPVPPNVLTEDEITLGGGGASGCTSTSNNIGSVAGALLLLALLSRRRR